MRRAHGFTLIEVLIYTVFVGMIMTSMVLLAETAFTVRSHLRASLILEENMRFAVDRITWLTGEATGITTPAAGASGSSLVLSMATSSENPTTITSSGGIITVTQGSGTAQALTSSEINVSSFTVTRVSGTAPLIRLLITAGTRNADATYPSLTVTTTASVRR